MRDVIPDIEAAGVSVVILGNGSTPQAARFGQEIAPGLPVYTDPTLQTYRALGARRSLAGILHPRVFLRALQARRSGHRQTGVEGDAWQLGGLFLILPDGAIPYAYHSAHAGDHPAPAEVLENIRRALATSP